MGSGGGRGERGGGRGDHSVCCVVLQQTNYICIEVND